MNQPTQLIDRRLLDNLSAEAAASPRRRKNYNFHASEADRANRLLNAVEPGSYVQPHRHLDSAKDETFVVLRGSFGLVLFDEQGNVTRTALLQADGDVAGVNILHGTFHCVLSLAPGSVFFEAKAGPYVPITGQERASWAPPEGDPQAIAYLAELEKLFR
jgi:cupin fold WbuC family metalloprotein